MRKLLAGCIVSVVLYGCSAKPAMPEMPINQMKYIIWDLMKADELVLNVQKRDSGQSIKPILAQYHATVYKLHNVQEADFKKSYKQYAENPVLMKELYDSVLAVSQRRTRAMIVPSSSKIN